MNKLKLLWGKVKEWTLVIVDYSIARLGENSTYRGLLVCVSSYSGWEASRKLDLTNPQLLEAVTWGGLFLVGLINILRKAPK
jgi:hypothetical protein